MPTNRIIVNRMEKRQPGSDTTLKCSRCFSRKIKRVCHHCGAYLCEKCEPWPVRWLRRVRLYKYVFKDHEFFGLYEFKPEFQLSAHCREHIHYGETIYHLLIWLIIIIGVAGAFILRLQNSTSMALGLGLMAAGALVGLLPTRALFYWFFFADPSRPFLVLPTTYKVEINESVTANFRVDPDMKHYLDLDSAIGKTSGILTISLSSLPDNYTRQNKGTKSGPPDTIRFSAGYLGLDSLKKVKFKPEGATIKFKDKVVPHGGEQVNHQGKLHLAGSLPIKKFEQIYKEQAAIIIEQPYEILEKAGWVGPECDLDFPIWIAGDLSLARRKLTVLIYVTPEIPKKFKLELLSLTFPDEVVKDGIEIHGRLNTTANTIFWVNPQLRTGEVNNDFFVKFRKPLRRDIDISGQYKISVEDFLLSGLKVETEGQLWFANGEPVPKLGSKVKNEEDWLEKLSKKTTFSQYLRQKLAK